MSEDKRERAPIGLSPAQIAGSALSAMSAAFVASWAGTTGTLIGAAIGSMVATIGAATYTWSLRRSSDAVRRAAVQVRQTSVLTGPLPRTVVDGPVRPPDDHEGPAEPPVPTGGKEGKEDEEGQESEEGVEAERRLSWGRVLLAGVALTVAVLGSITLIEAVTGSPISSWLGRSDSQGTTVGDVVRSDPPAERGPSTDTPTDSPGPTQTPRPSSPAAPEPSTTPPSDAPPQAPSEPAQPSVSTDP